MGRMIPDSATQVTRKLRARGKRRMPPATKSRGGILAWRAGRRVRPESGRGRGAEAGHKGRFARCARTGGRIYHNPVAAECNICATISRPAFGRRRREDWKGRGTGTAASCDVRRPTAGTSEVGRRTSKSRNEGVGRAGARPTSVAECRAQAFRPRGSQRGLPSAAAKKGCARSLGDSFRSSPATGQGMATSGSS